MSENAQQSQNGMISRVSGPIVEATGMAGSRMYEVVHVGPPGLVGEVIKVTGETATIQVYEHTGGLQPGTEVKRLGRQLSLNLGPGLLGGIFDGIQHPLEVFKEEVGAFIQRGAKAPPLDQDKPWKFEPLVEEGEELSAGERYGKVSETSFIDHFLMLPPDVSGTVTHIGEAGEHTVSETMCVVEDEDGEERELDMVQVWPVRQPRPFGKRGRPEQPLITGQRVLDTLFPVARGGTAAVPGDFGTGKTVVQQQLAKWSDADVVIYVGCGERGNEMTDILRQFPDLEDPRTGLSLMDRTVLVANTSNMPVAAREISIYTGITVAEYYRDMGYDVALMADSTSRWAEALREVSSRLEEMPAEEGFPAYLSSRLAQFYERAGAVKTLGGQDGSVTVVGAVSPPGGDFSEPVTQHTTRFTRCFWVLDRELAYARHFPAVSWDQSYTEYTDEIADWWEDLEPDWADLRREAMEVMQEYDRLQEIVQLVGPDVLPDAQRLILLTSEILRQGFLQQNAFHDVDSFCDPNKQAALLRAIVTFHRRASAIIDRGAPVMRIRELDIVQRLKRARFNVPNEDEEALEDLMQDLNKQLQDLEGSYQ
jgi:V/A-type H+-transporting ATPase subunit A